MAFGGWAVVGKINGEVRVMNCLNCFLGYDCSMVFGGLRVVVGVVLME